MHGSQRWQQVPRWPGAPVARKRRKAPNSRSSSSTSRAVPSKRRPTSARRNRDGEYTITFEFLPADADGQREQLVRRLGAEDPSIDILGMDVIWTAEFANAGWIQPWEGELKSQVTENVFDSVVEGASFEGDLYAAPFTSNTQLLWYRKDRVEQVPETWDRDALRGRADRRGRADPGTGGPVRGLCRMGELDDRVRRRRRCSRTLRQWASTRRRPRRRSRRWPASRTLTPRLQTSIPPPRTPRASRSRPVEPPSC